MTEKDFENKLKKNGWIISRPNKQEEKLTKKIYNKKFNNCHNLEIWSGLHPTMIDTIMEFLEEEKYLNKKGKNFSQLMWEYTTLRCKKSYAR